MKDYDKRITYLEDEIKYLRKVVENLLEPKVSILKSGGMPTKRVSKDPGDRE